MRGYTGASGRPLNFTVSCPAKLMRYRHVVEAPQAARFDTNFSVDEAMVRLSSATKAPGSRFLSSEGMLGRVSRGVVTLERVLPFPSQNAWKPVFVGHFEENNGRAALVGAFGLRPAIRALMYFFVASWLLWAIAALWVIHATPGQALPLWFPIPGIGLAALGIAVSRTFGFRFGGDISWLSERIANALSARVS